MANPWIKFYPRDWRGDQALRAVSIAARGLWMECLCIMHEANPRGHLMLNGSPVEDDTLARMAGVSVDEARFLLDELRQAGVLSVTRKGVIFSRRMTKDHARAQKGKASVEKRWKQRSSDDAQAPDTEQKSGAPNRYPNRGPITQKPEARVPSVDTDVSTAADAAPLDPEKLMFDHGIRLLGQGGVKDRQARSLLGKWRKEHGVEAVIAALGRAQREGAVEPVAFITGALKFAKAGGAGKPAAGQRKTTNDGRTLEWEGEYRGWVEVHE